MTSDLTSIAPTPVSLSAAPRGTLALIGGRFEADNHALFAALHERCNGRIAILSMASGYPEEVGSETVSEFRDQGFYAELVPIFHESRDRSPFDETLVERLRAFGSVFFTGGDQSRIVETLVQNGEETPALIAIREFYHEGGLVAGSSAGAAIMSGPMILGGSSLQAVSRGQDDRPEAIDDYDAYRLGTGLGFFTWGMVDQHFLARGRIGRLVCAARDSDETLAFGIDENSALIVQGERGEVVGETGVLLVDLRNASFNEPDYPVRGARISYLDDGDAIDLKRGNALPAADKKRTRVSRNAYRSPAPVRRNAFASYGLLDLMLRLVQGDPRFYHRDSASAFDPMPGHQVTLQVERLPRKSRALRAVRDGSIRYSALHFALDIHCVALDTCPLFETTQVLRPEPASDARLLLLGNAPVQWRDSSQRELLAHLQEPVGVLATASGEPTLMAERYLDWLDSRGVRCELLPISLNNIARASRDRSLLRTIDSMGSLILTGGDQRRLTEALLHCAEATPVLHSLVTAYERGVPLVAVAASAAALGERMIAEGDSIAALRYGVSEDASGSGVIVEKGIGLTDLGLVDQHFVQRHRLGRLLVACAQQQQRYGFGLCEGSGLLIHGDGLEIEALGSPGVVIAELDLDRVRLAAGATDPAGIRLYILEPGRRVRLTELAAQTAGRSEAATALLNAALENLHRDSEDALGKHSAFDSQGWQQTLTDAVRLH